MALQASGEIKFTEVQAELDIAYDIGVTDVSLRNMSDIAGKTVPDELTEFYGYQAILPPTLATTVHTGTGTYSLSFRQDITSNGFSTITSYGYQWGTSGYTNTVTLSNSNPGSSFNFSRSDLSALTYYYFRGWATNAAGTTYADGQYKRTDPCPAYGTYNSSYCSGCDLYYRYNNGSCGTYTQYQGYNPGNACGCANRIVSLGCSGDPYICCDSPCGYQENDDYSGLQSAIVCASGGWYTCTAGAYAGNTGNDCYFYWGSGTSWGDSTYGSTFVGTGSGRCTGGSASNYL